MSSFWRRAECAAASAARASALGFTGGGIVGLLQVLLIQISFN